MKGQILKKITVLTLLLLLPALSLFYTLFRVTSGKNIHTQFLVHSDTPMQVIASNPNRPLLRSLLNFTTNEIIGNVDFLLDFAIIGFPKCGTTAFQDWLSSHHDQIAMLSGEPFPLMHRKPHLLVWRLYTQLPAVPETLVRGYKNPLDIRSPTSVESLSNYFPRTLLIVGIRHPVHWFESLYNFKVQNLPPHVDPSIWGDPNELIDKCEDWTDTHCVGTAKAWYHVHLASLGKVDFPQEWKKEYPRYLQNITKVPNHIFLYESNQLQFQKEEEKEDNNDNNDKPTLFLHEEQFRQDLQNMLHLKHPLSLSMSRKKPDIEHLPPRQQRRKNRLKIDICNAQYIPLRNALMHIARQASHWIVNNFIQSPDVHVSSREYFIELMSQWQEDPCSNKNASNVTSTAAVS